MNFYNDSISSHLIQAIESIARYNSREEIRPNCILWTDGNREWEHLIEYLKLYFPNQILVLGDYEPDKNKGPGIWIRCVLAKMIPEVQLDESKTPIIYIPGFSREQMRAVESCPVELQPLAEYQYRGVFFTHENGRDWTLYSFLTNDKLGVGLRIKEDQQTKQAIKDTFRFLFQLEKTDLEGKILSASDFRNILIPNPEREIIEWLCEGDSFLDNLSIEERNQLSNFAKENFKMELSNSNLVIARQMFLSEKENWKKIWVEFKKNKSQYPNMYDSLVEITPQDLYVNNLNFPSEIKSADEKIGKEFVAISGLHRKEAEEKILTLYKANEQYSTSIWFDSNAFKNLIILSELKNLIVAIGEFKISSNDWKELSNSYFSEDYKIDIQVLEILKHTNTLSYNIVSKIVKTFYQPWLETINKIFIDSIKKEEIGKLNSPILDLENKTIRVFVDGLRMDYGRELVNRIEKEKNLKIDIQWRVSSFPSVTVSGKSLVQPLHQSLEGKVNSNEFTPFWKDKQTLFTKQSMESALVKAQYQELNSPEKPEGNAKGWIEIGNIDAKGHEHPSELAQRKLEFINEIWLQVSELLRLGWIKIEIVTDHGWLYMPGGLPKVNLPAHAVHTKWSRCAIMKEDIDSNYIKLPWTWNAETFVTYPTTINCFKEGEEYSHGGISLQEIIIPYITIYNSEMENTPVSQFRIVSKKWIGLRLVLRFENALEGYQIGIQNDLTGEKADSVSPYKPISSADGEISLPANDEFEMKKCFLIVSDSKGKRIYYEEIVIGDSE